MAQLPLFVRESFPSVLTHRSVVHMDVMEDVTDTFVGGKGFAASRAALKQEHQEEFHARELKYYSRLVWRRQNLLLQSATSERPFGSFDDPDYNGFVPSAHYLSSVWTNEMQTRPVAKIEASSSSRGRGMGTLVDTRFHLFSKKVVAMVVSR